MATLCDILHIEHPIIMAPMFLVSNGDMVVAALECGITAAIPAANYRKNGELASAIANIKQKSSKPFGINLVVNKSNTRYKHQLAEIISAKPAFIITSLGNPKQAIEMAHANGIKVFCDVVDLNFAQKVESFGADAIIAVNSKAGGHSGIYMPEKLMPELVANCKIPVIYAGGIASKQDVDEAIMMGAAGVSVGTIFIASEECKVSDEYKKAVVEYGAKDIVLTRKLSGSPTAVINTLYLQQIGNKPNIWERLVNGNSVLKKFAKSVMMKAGMKKLYNSAFKATYKTVWCAGVAIEHVHKIRSIREIIADLTECRE
ncbi:MAG: nitronate monooxygenase [Bacteroidales bacterium]|nr:nitronate monooxygenase [Bacteroidales bacterium]